MSANAVETKQQFNEQFYLLIKMLKGELPTSPKNISASSFSLKKNTNVPLNIIQDQDYEPSSLINLALNAKDQDKQFFLLVQLVFHSCFVLGKFSTIFIVTQPDQYKNDTA